MIPELPQKCVIILDDETSYVQLLAQVLEESLACPLYTFSRPLAALAALDRLDPAVIVTDYFMPELNGAQFMRRANQLRPKTNFLLITGHADMMPRDELEEIPGLCVVLAKPFGTRFLAEEIVRHWPADTAPPFKPDSFVLAHAQSGVVRK